MSCARTAHAFISSPLYSLHARLSARRLDSGSVGRSRQEYKDIQVQRSEFTGTRIISFTANAAEARFRGGEFETQLGLIDDLDLGANASYLKMKYTKFSVGDPRADWNRIAGSPIDASFFMTNVSNKDYVTGGNAIYLGSGYNTEAYGEPRMYGVRVRYNFGAEAGR